MLPRPFGSSRPLPPRLPYPVSPRQSPIANRPLLAQPRPPLPIGPLRPSQSSNRFSLRPSLPSRPTPATARNPTPQSSSSSSLLRVCVYTVLCTPCTAFVVESMLILPFPILPYPSLNSLRPLPERFNLLKAASEYNATHLLYVATPSPGSRDWKQLQALTHPRMRWTRTATETKRDETVSLDLCCVPRVKQHFSLNYIVTVTLL